MVAYGADLDLVRCDHRRFLQPIRGDVSERSPLAPTPKTDGGSAVAGALHPSGQDLPIRTGFDEHEVVIPVTIQIREQNGIGLHLVVPVLSHQATAVAAGTDFPFE